MGREEHADEEDVDGQPRGARHERIDEDRNDAARTAFDRARCHDCGYIATKAHHKRYERFTVQTNLVHEFVHDKSCAGHVT